MDRHLIVAAPVVPIPPVDALQRNFAELNKCCGWHGHRYNKYQVLLATLSRSSMAATAVRLTGRYRRMRVATLKPAPRMV